MITPDLMPNPVREAGGAVNTSRAFDHILGSFYRKTPSNVIKRDEKDKLSYSFAKCA
jgi:hypothetical protein